MATEQTSAVPTESESLAKWASWLAALVGLWVLATPFVLTGPIATGTAMWGNVVAGVLVLVFGAFGAYELRTSSPMASGATEWSGWLAALVGVWILVSPFVLTGSIASGAAMWSNMVAGLVVAVLAAYAGYELE